MFPYKIISLYCVLFHHHSVFYDLMEFIQMRSRDKDMWNSANNCEDFQGREEHFLI